jgi:hypothetical protein
MSETRVLDTLDVPWSAGLVLLAAGLVLLTCGAKWRDFTEPLSTALLGGLGALLFGPNLGVSPLWPALVACFLCGLLTMLFRRVAAAVLAGVVLGLCLSIAVNLLAQGPAADYLAPGLSNDQVQTAVLGPNYFASEWSLAVLVGGALLGVILSVASPHWTRRAVLGLEGGLALLAGVVLLTSEFLTSYLPPGYPMKYSGVAVLAWLELAILGVLVQRNADKRAEIEAAQPALRKDS